jgi:hypothetical protein
MKYEYLYRILTQISFERDHLENAKRDNGIILKSDLEGRDFQPLSGVELGQRIRSRNFFVVLHNNNCLLNYQSMIP